MRHYLPQYKKPLIIQDKKGRNRHSTYLSETVNASVSAGIGTCRQKGRLPWLRWACPSATLDKNM